jgi:hypothetical protein
LVHSESHCGQRCHRRHVSLRYASHVGDLPATKTTSGGIERRLWDRL